MARILERRRTDTSSRLDEIKRNLTNSSELASGKACVYATGSFGRGEASPFSDLDLFIVSKSKGRERYLKRLDEICIKADLIEVTQKLRLPEFSGDGRWLVSFSIGDLVETVGKPEDDVLNTFTARLLLLLESAPVIGEDVYGEAIGDIIESYWRDYEDHKSSFMPAYLTNDILRLWRTFCVNYEARTDRKPDRAKAKGKIKNYKLKHSRLLTCFSAVIFLMAIFSKHGSVHPIDVRAMVQLSPTSRLESLLADKLVAASVASSIETVLLRYEEFLEQVNKTEDELVELFLDKRSSADMMKRANGFGDCVFQVLEGFRGNDFYRMIVV